MNEVDVDKETGKVLEFRLTDETDVVTLIDSDGTGSEALYLSENNVITNVTLEHDSNGIEYDLYHITGDENADNIHRFLASGIKKEFSEIKTTSSDNPEKNYVMSSHHESAEYGVSDFVEKLPWNQIVREWTHSHPGGTPYPSGVKYGGRDMGLAQKLSNRYTPEPIFRIFIPPGAGSTNITDYRYINFNKNSLPSDF